MTPAASRSRLLRQRILTSRFDYYKTEDGSNTVGADNFRYKTVPHITLGGIANNVALDPIFAKWEPILDEKLDKLNDALDSTWTTNSEPRCSSKLEAKRRKKPRRDYPITEADERRWKSAQGAMGALGSPIRRGPRLSSRFLRNASKPTERRGAPRWRK